MLPQVSTQVGAHVGRTQAGAKAEREEVSEIASQMQLSRIEHARGHTPGLKGDAAGGSAEGACQWAVAAAGWGRRLGVGCALALAEAALEEVLHDQYCPFGETPQPAPVLIPPRSWHASEEGVGHAGSASPAQCHEGSGLGHCWWASWRRGIGWAPAGRATSPLGQWEELDEFIRLQGRCTWNGGAWCSCCRRDLRPSSPGCCCCCCCKKGGGALLAPWDLESWLGWGAPRASGLSRTGEPQMFSRPLT